MPRGNGKYIASFVAFAPSEDPQVIALVLVDEPEGIYYGGQVAGPVMNELLSNVLPYLGLEVKYNEKESEMDETKEITVQNFVNMEVSEVKKFLSKEKIAYKVLGSGDYVLSQFPPEGEIINFDEEIILYTE